MSLCGCITAKQALEKQQQGICLCLICPIHGFLDCRCEETDCARGRIVHGAGLCTGPAGGLKL